MRDTLPDRVRLGVFEVDLRVGELRSAGRTVLLQEQPLQILCMLVERDGDLVSREEIQKKLWPNDTVVEFDHSINAAIKRLRQAFGDSADAPVYVETIHRRGYRLLVPVERVGAAGGSSDSVPTLSPKTGEKMGRPQPGTSVLIGRTVSHYRVLDIVGGGGMGVVYRAEDLKLGRQVALKFLPEELGSDPQALERFGREARSASSLDHPNICSIYEFGEHEGRPFIVMQLLEGQTLRDRLAELAEQNGALPLDELFNIAIQVSGGLQAAHEKGIIHRDIKPANIFITNKGGCKILDFGLVKLLEGEEEEEVATQPEASAVTPPAGSGTLHLTRTGVAMGTAGYMSPEQVRGEKLDARTDIFSFGLVLYEMVTGQRAFTGETAAVVQEAILNSTPVPARELSAAITPGLEAVIAKALQKDREQRYQSAAELGTDLRSLQQPRSTRSRKPRLMLASIAAVVLCATGLFLLRSKWQKPEPAKEPIVRQLTPVSGLRDGVAISPDGKHLAYSDRATGISLLQIDSGESRLFPDTASFYPIGWLPDGDHLFVRRKIVGSGTWKMSTVDGIVRKFRDEDILPLASPDGKRLTYLRDGEIWVTDAKGEAPHKVLSVDPAWFLTEYIAWSPSGRRIAYEKIRVIQSTARESKTFEDVELDSCDLDGQCSTILSDPNLFLSNNTSSFAWLPDGRIIFNLRDLPPNPVGSNLWSLRVDPITGRAEGMPKRLTDWTGFEQDQLTASTDGRRLVFQELHTEDVVKIAELRAEGRELGAARPLNSETWASAAGGWTPDSQGVLFAASRYGKKAIFKQNLNDPSPQPLVSGSEGYDRPVITPDGQWLLYSEYASDGSGRLMRIALQGGAATIVLTGSYGYRCATSPSALCVLSERQGNQLGFSLLDPFKGRDRKLVTVEMGNHAYFWDLSPDGKNIALVYYGGGNQVRILGTEGGPMRVVSLREWSSLQNVSWSGDGRHLYVSGWTENGDVSAILETDLAGNFKVLKEMPSTEGWVHNPIASPDGRYLSYSERTWPSSIVMLENF